jgi:hypothetical protein
MTEDEAKEIDIIQKILFQFERTNYSLVCIENPLWFINLLFDCMDDNRKHSFGNHKYLFLFHPLIVEFDVDLTSIVISRVLYSKNPNVSINTDKNLVDISTEYFLTFSDKTPILIQKYINKFLRSIGKQIHDIIFHTLQKHADCVFSEYEKKKFEENKTITDWENFIEEKSYE